ncbi:Flp pilus assembly protein CpaB [Comamonas composti]|uniref:Flp pilus assembly protein CpaB n=1 Tax=Comamonas composti TaxID=408558 RepID=UPI0003FAF120|nr:Flp pilus assembly protein CpaB [Comamonas composti]
MAVSINKNWLLLAAAIALGAAAFYLSNRAITTRITEIEEEATRGKTLLGVVVANRPMRAGEVIDAGSVSVRQIPAEFVSRNMVTPDTYDGVDGQALVVDLDRGEALQVSHTASLGGEIFAATLKSGRRALTIDVDEISSISGMLRAGDRIDLMLTATAPVSGQTAGETRELTFPLLSNVEVIATGQQQKGVGTTNEAIARAYSHVTLDVLPEDATRIIAAKAGGHLTAVLRAPGDERGNPSMALTLDDVVAGISSGLTGSGRMVEFLIGGSGSGSAVSRTPVLDAVMKDPRKREQAESIARDMLESDSGAGVNARARAVGPQAAAASGTATTSLPGTLASSAMGAVSPSSSDLIRSAP